MKQFEFTAKQRIKAHAALEKNGFDEAAREGLIAEAEQTGKTAMFGYGSLLHTVFTDQSITETAAQVTGYGPRFSQAFDYYGGEDGLRTLMLAMEPAEEEVVCGAIQEYTHETAEHFISFYEDLQMRENPVNNPIYRFNRTVKAQTIDGRTVTCITCLCDTDCPLYIGNALTEDEQASILAHAIGPDQRLDNKAYRNTDGKVKYLSLDAHQKTGAAYFYHYLAACEKWGFPENAYMKRLAEKINQIRRDMGPAARGTLEARENEGNRPEGLGPRYNVASSDARQTPEDITRTYIKTNDKLNQILLKRASYKTWQREWDVPERLLNCG